MATRATLNFYSTVSSKLDNIAVKDGNLIFVRDLRKIYQDALGVRTEYSTIVTLMDEEQRTTMTSPLNGFYFVKETLVLWNYDGVWNQLTTPPTESPIVFINDNEALPNQGNVNTLYVKRDKIMKWNTDHYLELGGSVWESFE